MKRLLSFFKGEKAKGVFSPDDLVKQRKVKFAILLGGGALLLFLLAQFSLRKSHAPKEKTKTVVLDSSLDAVSSKERWANRLEKEAGIAKGEAIAAKKEAIAAKNQQKILEKKVDILESLFKTLEEKGGEVSKKEDTPIVLQKPSMTQQRSRFLSQKGLSEESQPQVFPTPREIKPASLNAPQSLQKNRPRILHLSLNATPRKRPKTVDSYVTSGTYSRGVLLSGLAVSTSLSTQSNPQPIVVRLVDPGVLPKGFHSDIKDAVLIGACYGDLSAERAFCRLNSITLVENNGEVLERKVEGWIFGEDGRPGLKGDVVDRAGDIARNAMMAGILGGMSKFLENQATSSVFPVSPFGQTNALKGRDMLAGGAASGAASAFEKLADFSIKRAEAMQPIILVSSGRMVDVFFKTGVDLSGSTVREELKLIGSSKRKDHARQEAQNTSVQLQ